ncbi:L,D-transpeptidase family protein [Microbacterium sp. ASV49]|uniref:L,D-transpeptidase family protein n=1 Tax=Microbacterium candidum TaxID=3041922 RepID=A0ABT7MX05_9MICO|nr:L,D-transpeptidase family protein [Microbacterium sp. ASV49]MDL9978987.1 L,D-transpeptidase family protein [Microbacterium sp. ASV49]
MADTGKQGDTGPVETGTGTTYAWAPAEPAPHKRHLGAWIGVPAGIAMAAVVAVSLVLIAPGASVASVPVGGMTAGAAADAISSKLASTTVTLSGPDGNTVTVTGADLGAHVDARTLAQDTYSDHPLWNVTGWFPTSRKAEVTVNANTVATKLHAAFPSLYTPATDAKVAYDATTGTYEVTPAKDGTSVDVDAVRTAIQKAFSSGAATAAVPVSTAVVPAATTTAHAQEFAGKLNAMLDTVGFYVGDERTVPVDRGVAASWLTLDNQANGSITVTADSSAIQKTVDTLPAGVNRAPENGAVITNSSGTVLRTIAPGQSGRTLGDTSGIAVAFAKQLSNLDGAYKLTVAEVAPQEQKVQRLLEVNLTTQTLYLKENGQVVDSWLISSGRIFPTKQGHFRINSHITSMTMKGSNPDGTKYAQPDVPWIMYFNGDQGFHGVYWHHNWGHPMSHGCVGMPVQRAQQLYNWTPTGTDVWVHS